MKSQVCSKEEPRRFNATTTTTTTTIDIGQILIRKAHLSLLLRWVKRIGKGWIFPCKHLYTYDDDIKKSLLQLGQFQPNLTQHILYWRRFEFNNDIVKIQRGLLIFPPSLNQTYHIAFSGEEYSNSFNCGDNYFFIREVRNGYNVRMTLTSFHKRHWSIEKRTWIRCHF